MPLDQTSDEVGDAGNDQKHGERLPPSTVGDPGDTQLQGKETREKQVPEEIAARHTQGDKRIEGFDRMPLATEPVPYRLNSQAAPNGKFEALHRSNNQPRRCDGQAQREPKAQQQEGTHGADCNFLGARKATQARPQATLV